jgi:hypothetical protein
LSTFSADAIKEAIRLVVDEEAKEVFCSSMQKDKIGNIAQDSSTVSGFDTYISFGYPSGKTISNSDKFTIEMDWGEAPSDIGGGGDEYSEEVAQFFGLPEALPEIEVATEQEVKDINDDVMGALYGYGKVTVTIHSLMRTGAETTQDLASVVYVDPSKTWAENGFPTLYDDEGTAIDTTTNPSEGDEVYLYQITQNS